MPGQLSLDDLWLRIDKAGMLESLQRREIVRFDIGVHLLDVRGPKQPPAGFPDSPPPPSLPAPAWREVDGDDGILGSKLKTHLTHRVTFAIKDDPEKIMGVLQFGRKPFLVIIPRDIVGRK